MFTSAMKKCETEGCEKRLFVLDKDVYCLECRNSRKQLSEDSSFSLLPPDHPRKEKAIATISSGYCSACNTIYCHDEVHYCQAKLTHAERIEQAKQAISKLYNVKFAEDFA